MCAMTMIFELEALIGGSVVSLQVIIQELVSEIPSDKSALNDEI